MVAVQVSVFTNKCLYIFTHVVIIARCALWKQYRKVFFTGRCLYVFTDTVIIGRSALWKLYR